MAHVSYHYIDPVLMTQQFPVGGPGLSMRPSSSAHGKHGALAPLYLKGPLARYPDAYGVHLWTCHCFPKRSVLFLGVGDLCKLPFLASQKDMEHNKKTLVGPNIWSPYRILCLPLTWPHYPLRPHRHQAPSNHVL